MATKDNASKTFLGKSDNELQKSTAILQAILANTIFMYSLYKKYHWHVIGKDFYEYHLLFDKHAKQQLPLIDTLAERLRTLGDVAPGMPQEVAKNTTLTEPRGTTQDPVKMIDNLLTIHEAYIQEVRGAIDITNASGDEGTSDLLVSDILRVHELQTWFIRSSKP